MRKAIKCRCCEEKFTVKASREGEAWEADICPDCYEEEKQAENEEGSHD